MTTKNTALGILIGSINEMWPYYYHNRKYGNQTFEFLRFINDLENAKWTIGGFNKALGFGFEDFGSSDMSVYSNPAFLER